ncbi:cytidylate kinase-like family protein [Qiania dongpingensis]|uniref:Cytidylate kinase-like family protein n=1 Tax=Qiania dongpingensis TaxID=2763669 RepID=A0A7G9G6A4_9FIRM|nr:cytidylate kinase-like family protein [Qiania dongpingensis]QNM06336.1 cytidylate kinase-like family protein [Qiania dongpingensis]
MAKKIITISREFGSGGRTIGRQTAERLGISFYDKELIEKVAKESGLSEQFVAEQGEDSPTKNRFAYSFLGRESNGMSVNDYLWSVQRKIILELAEKESCVIVGRCADYILRDREDCLHAFICADVKKKAERIVKLYGETEKKPEKRLAEKDKKRRLNYEYYTERKWGMAQNYHISLDSGVIGLEKCVDILADLAGME